MLSIILAFVNGFFFGIFCLIVSFSAIMWTSSEPTKNPILAKFVDPIVLHTDRSSLRESNSVKSSCSPSASVPSVYVRSDYRMPAPSRSLSGASDCIPRSHDLPASPRLSLNRIQPARYSQPRSTAPALMKVDVAHPVATKREFPPSTASAKKTKIQKRLEAIATAKAMMQSDKEQVELRRRQKGKA